MAESLKNQVIKGAFWNGLERFGTAFFLFVSNLILARLLSPDDFGCIGMLMVFISVSDAIIDGGFGAALVQKKEISKTDYSTIFLWNVFVSIILYLVLFFSAPAIASFYHIESLSTILRVQGVVLLFNGLCVIQRSMLQRKLLFRKLAKINLSATVVGTLFGIICAFAGFGVWSLVIKLLFTSIIVSIVLWARTKWVPVNKFSGQSFRTLFNFGSFVFLTSITNSIHINFISLVIGKSINSATLGYFTQARKLEDVPRQTISSIVRNVAFPAFSMLQDDKEKLLESVRMTTRTLSYINFSLTILLIVIARPLILLLFTKKWEQSIPYFQIICLFGLIYTITEFYNSILKARGASRFLFMTNFLYKAFGVLLMFLGSYFGMKGILFSFVASYYLGFVLVSYTIYKTIHYKISTQIIDLFPSISIALFSGLITWFVCGFFRSSSHLICLVVGIAVFISVTILISHLTNLKPYLYLRETIRNMG